MEVNITGFLVTAGCGALLCILWFFLALRREYGCSRAAVVSVSSLVLGTVLGVFLARLVWVLCMIQYRYPLFALNYDELSYYGGMAGVILGVFLAAKIGGLGGRKVLNVFAPMGAMLAVAVRFAEYFLAEYGCGAYMEQGLFFPLTVEFRYDESFAEYYQAVFMLEDFFALAAMVFALVRKGDTYRWVRTVFYLCLPQILCESLRLNSIAWRFVKAEQLFCFLLCEGVLAWYALKAEKKGFSAWVPALTGLLVCGLVIVAEFAKDGKIMIHEKMISQWIIYGAVAAGLALMAVMEHRGYRRLSA